GVANQSQTCSAVLSTGTFNGRPISATITPGVDARLPAFLSTATAGCTYTGNYTQEGRFGRSIGSFTCSNGEAGTFDFFEMQRYFTGIVARYSATSQYCPVTG